MSDRPGWGAAPGWGGPQAWGRPPAKPGIIPLRPLGVGEILDGAISALRANPRTMLGLSAVVAVLTQLVQVPILWALLHGDAGTLRSDASPQEVLDFLGGTLTSSAITGVISFLATTLLTGIVTVAVSRAVLGQQLSVGEAWAGARGRLLPLFGATILYGLVVALPVLIGVLPGVLVAVAGSAAGVAVALLVLGGTAGVVCAIWLALTFTFVTPVVVLERQRIIASFRRSRVLVSGAWWRTFGLVLLTQIIGAVAAAVVTIPFTVITMAIERGPVSNPFSIIPLLISSVGEIVASTFVWPFTAAATVLIYVDRRIRREGLDLELARAAGVPSGPSSAVHSGQPDQYGQPAQPGQYDQPMHYDQPMQYDQPTQPGQYDQPMQPGQYGSPGRPDA